MRGEVFQWQVALKPAANLEEISRQFLVQQNSMLSVKLLCRLTRAVQKHRGASLACLDGDIKFAPAVLSLQNQIEKYLAALDTVTRGIKQPLLNQSFFSNVRIEWATIAEGWQRDNVVQNYEFHCHLVEAIRIVSRHLVSDHLMKPLSCNESSFRAEFETVLITLIDTIELIAKLRGLATHVATLKSRNGDLYSRIGFLLKTIPQENSALYHTLQAMEDTSLRVSGMNRLALQQTRVSNLLDEIQTEIVNSDQINIDAGQLFEQATTIIDTYWQILDQSIVVTEECIFGSFASA